MDSVLRIEELLEPIPGDAPCGAPDDATQAQIAAFDGAIKRAAETGEVHVLRQAAEGLFRGGEIPDLGSRDGDSKVQVKPVKHLKAAMVLTMTALEMDGLPGFSDGLALIERLLSTQWDNVLPPGNPDDPEEPFISRVNILMPLSISDPEKEKATIGAVVGGDSWRIEERLFKAPLLRSDRHGAITLRDCLSPWAAALKLRLPAGEDRPPEFVQDVLLGAAGPELDAQRETLRTACSAVQGIAEALKKVPGEIKPKLDYLNRLLSAASDVIEDRMGARNPGPVPGPNPKPDQPHSNGSGPVSSREDAVRKLAEVAEYYRRNEPASPIPLLLERARKLAGMNFHDLLVELKLGDQAAPEFRKIAGLPEPPPPAS